jgi:hypothetical protein
MLCTDSRTSTWAVTRGSEGTVVSHAPGFTIRQVWTAKTLAVLGGLRPSGDTTGAADTTAIKALLAGTLPVCLLSPGTFYYNATLTVPAGGVLRGAGWGATILQAAAPFTFDGSGAMVNVTGDHADVGLFRHNGGPNLGSITAYQSNPAGNGLQLQPGAQYADLHDLAFYSQNGTDIAYVAGGTSAQVIGTMISRIHQFQSKQGMSFTGSSASNWNGQLQITDIQAGQMSGHSLEFVDIQDMSVKGYNDSVVGGIGVSSLHVKGNCSAIRIANPDLGQFPNTGANIPNAPTVLIEDGPNGAPNDVTLLPGVVQQGSVGILIQNPSAGAMSRITSYCRTVQNQGHGALVTASAGFAITFRDGAFSSNGQFSTTIAAGSNGAVLPQATINVASAQGAPASGQIYVTTSGGVQTVTYTGTTATTFTGCTGGSGTMSTGGAVALVCQDLAWTGAATGNVQRNHFSTAIGNATNQVTNAATFAGAGQVAFDDNEIANAGATTANTFGTAPKWVRRNRGYNPTGAVAITVPASGSATAGRAFDMTFYITAGTSTCSCAVSGGGPTVVIPANGFGTLRIPAGITFTPTYTNAPTWVVEGE